MRKITLILLAGSVGLLFERRIAAQEEEYVSELVSQLDGLRDDASRDEFLNRPAVMELLALADRPIPALGRALKSPRWSIRASALYIIITHGDEQAAGLYVPSLFRDPHPAVRAGALAWAGASAASEDLKNVEKETQYITRWGLRPGHSLDWLPDRFYLKRLENYAAVLTTHKPFSKSLGVTDSEDWTEPETPGAISAAKNAFQYELASARGHQVGNRLLELAHQIHPDQESRLAHILEVTTFLPRHKDRTHAKGTRCPLDGHFNERLCSLIQERVWSTSNRALMERGLSLLTALVDTKDERVSALIEKFAMEHPDNKVRERAKRILALRPTSNPSAGVAADIAAREPILHAPSPKPSFEKLSKAGPSSGPKENSPSTPEPQQPDQDRPHWLIGSVIAAGVIIVLITIFKTRRSRAQ